MGQSCSNIVLSMLPCCQKITNRTLYQLCKTTLCNIVILKWQRCYNFQTTQIATWEMEGEYMKISVLWIVNYENFVNTNHVFLLNSSEEHLGTIKLFAYSLKTARKFRILIYCNVLKIFFSIQLYILSRVPWNLNGNTQIV